MSRWIGRTFLPLAMAVAAATAIAQEPTAESPQPDAKEQPAAPARPAATTQPAAAEWRKPIPLSFTIDYSIVSDYVFRGVNYSEYGSEGREKLNHQNTVGLAYDTGKFGTFGVKMWTEWFAAQERLTPESGGHRQESDYIATWAYAVQPLATTVTAGYINYQFPRASGDAGSTQELFVQLTADECRMFGFKAPVLCPYVAYYHDIDLIEGGWFEAGVSHAFAAADFGCGEDRCLKYLKITPSAVLGIDHRYYGNSTRLGNITWGLDFPYDLGGACGMDPKYGSVTLTPFLRFSQALEDTLHDEFWGGVTVTYSW